MKAALLAAGSSSRMGAGRDKLLEPVGGVALIRRQALELLRAGIGPVAVALPADRPAREAALAGLDVTRLRIADAGTGMSAGLRACAQWAGSDALMVIPADMPDLTAVDFQALSDSYDGQVLRACAADGRPGHPVVFAPATLPHFAELTGDEGARRLLRRFPPRLLALPGTRAITDLDTPEDWDAWRRAHPGL